MIAILGGLGAACCWAASSLVTARSSRIVGAPRTLAWVMLVGLALLAPFALVEIPRLGAPVLALLLLAGGGNVVGLLFEYAGMRRGRVGVVTSLASTEGAIAALISAAGGEAIGALEAVGLLVIAVGVALAASAAGDPSEPPSPSLPAPQPRLAAALGLLAAASWGVSLFATGRLGSEAIPMAWVILPPRVLGTLFIAGPLLARRRLAVSGRVAPLLVAAGLLEIVGFISYVLGANDGIAVASVMASEFAALAAVGAWVVFGERLSRVQVGGVGTIAVGVATLALAR